MAENQYSSDKITVLKGLEAVRKSLQCILVMLEKRITPPYMGSC